jgi:hypothetical protein
MAKPYPDPQLATGTVPVTIPLVVSEMDRVGSGVRIDRLPQEDGTGCRAVSQSNKEISGHVGAARSDRLLPSITMVSYCPPLI